MADENQEAAKCLTCSNAATTRGLCPKCYGTAAGLVKAGKTTWDALVEVGLALESKRVSTGPSAFAAAFATCDSPSGQSA